MRRRLRLLAMKVPDAVVLVAVLGSPAVPPVATSPEIWLYGSSFFQFGQACPPSRESTDLSDGLEGTLMIPYEVSRPIALRKLA